MWIARAAALMAAGIALLSGAAVASADTTIVGSTSLTPNAANLDDFGQNIPVFQGDSGGNYVLASPQSGTLTSWSFLSGGASTGEQYELRILRPNGQSWSAIATSAPVSVTTGQGVDAVNGPFPTSLAIAAGDRIALQAVGVDGVVPIEQGTNGTDGVRYFATPFADGTTAPLAPGSDADNGQVIPVQATVTYNAPPPVRTLTVSLAGTGTGTVTSSSNPAINCPGTCTGQYANGTPVSLTATPATGSQFTGWSGACTNATGTCDLTLGADAAVTATFAPAPPPVNTVRPAIGGTPKYHQIDYCNVGTWTVSSMTTYTEDWYVLEYNKLLRQVLPRHLATGFAYTVDDLPPGNQLYCTVTATDSAGRTGAASAPSIPIQATKPAISPFGFVTGLGHSSSFPQIQPLTTLHQSNRCTQGNWLHYPSSYKYEWFSVPTDTAPVTAGKLVGSGPTLEITGALQAAFLVCRVSATNAAGTTTALSNRYLIAQPNLGFHVNAIEITQGIQTTELPTRSASNPFQNFVHYNGAELPERPHALFKLNLAAGHATVVRVYANSDVPLGDNGVPTMTLSAMRVGGPELGTITPDQIPPASALPQGRLGQVDPALRANPNGAYTFTLPADWTNGDIYLTAKIAPSLGLFTSILRPCNACAAERQLSLGPEHFYRLKALQIEPVAANVQGTLPPDPDPAWSEVQAVTPFQLLIPPYQGTIDGAAAGASSITVTSCFTFICHDTTYSPQSNLQDFYQEQNDILSGEMQVWTADNIGFDPGVYPYALTPANPRYSGGVTTMPTLVRGDRLIGRISVASDDRPVTGIAHELGHFIGRVHAGLQCGSDGGGQVGEPWPPTSTVPVPATATAPATTKTIDGNLDGYVLDTNTPSPYALRAPAGQFDLMSYCTGGSDALGWISVLNWNRAIDDTGYPVTGSVRRAARTKRANAAVAQFTPDPASSLHATRSYGVLAAYDAQSQTTTILSIRPDAGAPTPTVGSSAFTLIGRNAAGDAMPTAGTTATLLHVDHGIPQMLIYGKVPATGLHELDIANAGTGIAKDVASPHRPEVSIGSLGRRRVGGRAGATLRWRATDADGNNLTADVDYSADGGRTWRALYTGASRGSLKVPSRLLTRSSNARVRVTVTDGFNAAIAVSRRFATTGAPPTVTITSPPAGPRVSAGSALNLSATAWSDAARLLRGHALVWRDGKRRLGIGAALTVRSLTAGRHRITVTATRDGTASRSVIVTVTPTAPVLDRLRTPAKVSRRARTLTITIATLTPATLTTGRRHVTVGSRPRRITIAIKQGSSPLGIVLTLTSGRYRLRVPFRVNR